MGTHFCKFSSIYCSWCEIFCCFWTLLVVIISALKTWNINLHKTSPNKSEGKCATSTVCTPCYTFTQQISSAAFDLAPQSKTTTVCLAFCIDHSSMVVRHELNTVCQLKVFAAVKSPYHTTLEHYVIIFCFRCHQRVRIF